MQIQQLAPGIWHQVLTDKKNYLINQSNPENFEELHFRMSANYQEDSDSKLFLYKQPSGDFIYIFFENVYKISDVQDVVVFDFSKYENEIFHLLAILDHEKLSFFSLTTSDSSKANDPLLKFIGSLPMGMLPLEPILWRSNLRFNYENGYYYFNVSKLLAYTNVIGLRQPITYFRLNKDKIESHDIPIDSRFYFENAGLLETIITPRGLFDVSSFTFFDLQDLHATLRYSFDAYSYKTFTLKSSKKILFISKDEIYYPHIGKGGVEPTERKGILYDLTNQKLIYPKSDILGFWGSFILYDSELPHIFKTQINGKTFYHVIYWDDKNDTFSYIDSVEAPKAFSFYDNSTERKKSLIFIKTATNPEYDTLIVLDHSLRIELIEEDVTFKAMISLKQDSCFSSQRNKLVTIDVAEEPMHSCINSSVVLGFIVYSNKGTNGELVYVPYADKISIDYSISFFSCEFFTCTGYNYFTSSENTCVIPYLKACCRRNDFENQTFIRKLRSPLHVTTDPSVSDLTKFALKD